MARQESILKMRGVIGDLSFSKHRTRGYEVRAKGGVSKDRIMNDPNYVRTRENMREFGTASNKSRQIRRQLNNLSRGMADGSMGNRLLSLVYRIQKRDSESTRGSRTFRQENAKSLQGFEFNRYSNLSAVFSAPLDVSLDREAGTVKLVVPPFDPRVDVYLFQDATHIRFSMAAAILPDTDMALPRPIIAETDYIPLIGEFGGTDLYSQIPTPSADVVYTVVGISVYQRVNRMFFSLNNGIHNALSIVQVDLPEE